MGPSLHGRVWPCTYVQLAVLGHVPPSPLAITCPAVLVTATVGRLLETQGAALQRARQGLLCGTECEPSLDGLLDLFN